MMTYTMPKPSDNMKKSISELAAMDREWRQQLSDNETNAEALAEATMNREIADQARIKRDMMHEQEVQRNNRRTYLSNLKASLLSECMMNLFRHSAVGPLTESDTIMAKNLINSFIKDNGVDNMISDFKLKNQVLSEYARIVDKYYHQAIDEHFNDSPEEDRPAIGLEPKECRYNTTISSDFFKDLANVDDETVSKMIKARVADAINDFIDDNTESRMEYQDIIQDAQDKIDNNKEITEESANAYMAQAKRKINEAKLKKTHNTFHYLVENLTKGVMKDDTLKQKFVHESKVDMDGIVNSAALIYTMLEMANTTNMVNVDEEYIKEYIAASDR